MIGQSKISIEDYKDFMHYTYPVMEHFYTLQGEGVYSGNAAYFIRLGGCDVGCVWCDVKESWSFDAHPHLTIEEILKNALHFSARIAVITGGEPTLHNLKALTQALKFNGFRTHIETSGTSLITGNWDWITLSPKKFKSVLNENLIVANELKIIVYHKSDFQWAEGYADRISADCKLLLQPEWSKRDLITPLIIDYIKNNPKWNLSLQTHKYLDIP